MAIRIRIHRQAAGVYGWPSVAAGGTGAGRLDSREEPGHCSPRAEGVRVAESSSASVIGGVQVWARQT